MNGSQQTIKIFRPPSGPILQNRTNQLVRPNEYGALIEQPKFYAPQNLNATPDDQKRGSFTPLLIIFIIVIVIISLALVYSFRDKIFKKGTTLGSAPPPEQTQAGYGSYGPPVNGLCKTQSGLCSDAGSQTVTQQCIPNPITSLGCLDDNGSQTFAPKVSNQNCNIPCRQFKFIETTRNPNLANKDLGTYDSVCKYYPSGQKINDTTNYPNYNDPVDYPCLPNNKKIGQYLVKRNTCLPNDKIGTNECSVTCGEINYSNAPNGFNLSPIEDPESVLYIPVCDKVLQTTLNYTKQLSSRHFYLNTFPWAIAFNLPQNGIVIGKGFTIKNLINSTTGAIDLNNFSISPPYVSPYKYVIINGVSTFTLITDEADLKALPIITVQQLEDLDSNLYTYQNCEVANPRPFCGKYYLYNRTPFTPNVGVNETTLNTRASVDPPIDSFNTLSNGQYTSSRNCYYNDYNSSDTTIVKSFQSPYDFINFVPTSGLDYYSKGYKPYGIGMFGYTSDQLTCLSSITTPSQASPDQANAYNVPPSNGLCLALNPIDNSTYASVLPADLISTNCFPLDTTHLSHGYLPENLPYTTDYPPTGNKSILNTCTTQISYEEGPISGPGILGICRYMPNNEDLFTPISGDPLYGLTPELTQLLGYYIRLGVNDSSTNDAYYLSLQNTPCDCAVPSNIDYNVPNCAATVPYANNVNLNDPLGNCGGNPNIFGVGPIPTMLIYNGTISDPYSGGTYWERSGCDSYLMNAVNALQLIISPIEYDQSSGKLLCNIMSVFMGSYNGIINYDWDTATPPPTSPPPGNPNYGILTYVPVKPGDISPVDNQFLNKYVSGYTTKFAISYNVTNGYSIYGYNPTTSEYSLPLRVPTFNGTGPLDVTTNYYTMEGSATLNINLYEKPDLSDPTTTVATTSTNPFKGSNLIPFNPYYVKVSELYTEQSTIIQEDSGLYPNVNLTSTILGQQTLNCSAGTQTCNLFCSY